MSKKRPAPPAPQDWHRYFGLLLKDLFTDSPFHVELEMDLSLQQQFLDVVVVRRRKGRFAGRLPDGLDDLAEHNLITFKSHREALDDWALKELTGHYVNYRKQASPRKEGLLPEEQFGLYAVCARYPHNLAAEVTLQQRQAGVYDCHRGSDRIRVVVAAQLPQAEHNAPLHFFSASRDQVGFAAGHYRQRSEVTSTLLQRLFQGYLLEGVPMPYTIEQLVREFIEEHREELLARVPPEDRVKDLTPEQRTQGLTPEQRVAGLSPEERQRLLQLLQQQGATSAPTRRPRKR